MTATMPSFGVSAYGELLEALRATGYRFAAVADLPVLTDAPTVMLRHDVDLDPPSTLPIAEREAQLGISATYYVPLTQHFNVLAPEHRAAISRLRELGHEIGLHYDLRTYPHDEPARRRHLDREVELLAELAGAPVRTLCMHQPFRGHPDPFRSVAGLVHPHDPALQERLVYVSDSCRAWRDRTLLTALGEEAEQPRRLLLNTHPELWLDVAVEDQMAYLDDVLAPILTERARAFLADEAAAWRGHSTARERV